MRKELAVLAAASLLVTTATAQDLMGQSPEAQVVDVPVVQGRIDAISGVVYSQVFERGRSVRGLKMTLFVPRTKEKKPAVLYFPGGGFTSADHEKFLEMRYALARAGYVVAACEYRAVPNKFPALLEDAKAAVRWMRAHASEFGVDADRIGLLGDSAGGYVVQMAGATTVYYTDLRAHETKANIVCRDRLEKKKTRTLGKDRRKEETKLEMKREEIETNNVFIILRQLT